MVSICIYIHISIRLVWNWYYLKSLLVGNGIKLVPYLSHTILVWYLIPILKPNFYLIYQTNTSVYVAMLLYKCLFIQVDNLNLATN
jgi:hypothetical protein